MGRAEFSRRRRPNYGSGALYIFTTAVHSSLLGPLLTFSLVLWDPVYAERTTAWGLTPLEDQQLGGLVMWIPTGVIDLAATLALLAERSPRRARCSHLARGTRHARQCTGTKAASGSFRRREVGHHSLSG